MWYNLIKAGNRVMITLNQLNQERDKGDSPIDGSNSKVVSGVWEKTVESAR